MIHGGEIYDKEIEYDLSVNLNPNPCPEKVMRALEEAVSFVGKYPDISQREFRKYVADAENRLLGENLLTEKNILGGNGASELIFAICRMLHPRNVLIPIPSFYGYRHAVIPDDVNIMEYELREEDNFELTDGILDKITEETDLLILANPNNPTGKTIDQKVFEEIIDRCAKMGTKLIVDECFLHLSDGTFSAIKYLGRLNGLFIINAYTKLFSIPGVRVGYCISDSDSIGILEHFLPEWNMSVFAQAAGVACAEQICETDFVKESKDIVRKMREDMTALLTDAGLKVFPSDSCFVLVKSSLDLYNIFLKEKILIRDCSNFRGLEKGFYRISVSGDKVLRDNIKIKDII